MIIIDLSDMMPTKINEDWPYELIQLIEEIRSCVELYYFEDFDKDLTMALPDNINEEGVCQLVNFFIGIASLIKYEYGNMITREKVNNRN